MGRQRQLTVYDNTEVASGVRDGDASAEHLDVVAVDPVHKLIMCRVVGFLCCMWCIKLWDLGGATAATRVVTGGA